MSSNIQQKVIDYIFDQHNSRSEAVLKLKEILSISQSAVYKRTKGDCLLTLSELEQLISHYNIPADVIVKSNPEKVVFDFPPLADKFFSKDRFLSLLLRELKLLSQSTGSFITQTTIDVPIFYYFMSKELAWFKLFRFKHGISQKNITQVPKINFNAIAPKDQQAFKRIVKLFSQIDSTELWTSQAIKVTVDEIYYFYKADLFNSLEDALMLLEKLEQLSDRLFEIIAHNNKGLMNEGPVIGGKLNLSYNDFSRFSAVIVSKSDNHSALFLTYNVPNFMHNNDEKLIGYTLNWISKLSCKAQPLTNTGELHQTAFFKEIKDYIVSTKDRIIQLNRKTLVVSI